LLRRILLSLCIFAIMTYSTVENENGLSANQNLQNSEITVSNTVADSQFQKMEADSIVKDTILKITEITKEVVDTKVNSTWIGGATYYGKSHQGNKTANGERFNMYNMTAAAPVKILGGPKLPFGSKVRVTNMSNSKSVIVTITDRGGFAKKFPKNLDLSFAAFTKIATKGTGRLTNVKFELL